MSENMHVRDGVLVYLFVRHEGFDAQGNQLPDDGSCFPGARKKKLDEDKDLLSTSNPFSRKADV